MEKKSIVLHKETLNDSKHKFWMAFVECLRARSEWLKCEDFSYLKMLIAIIQFTSQEMNEYA